MKVETYVLGPLQTNTYLLQIDNDVLLMDPASKAEKLIDILGERNLIGILLTHGHFDHIKAVDGLYDKYHCPVYIHKDDEPMAKDKSSGSMFGLVSYMSCPSIHIQEGINKIGPFEFEVIYTPGHSEGSVIYVFDDCIFTGDTLFKGSIGRTDLKGGSFSTIKQSLQIFKSFDKNYIIYPGHDLSTTLYEELNFNPFLQ